MKSAFARLLSVLFVSIVLPASALAADDPLTTYFTIPEKPSFQQTFSNPLELVQMGFVAAGTIDLLALEYHGQAFPLPREAYNRKAHFGLWVNDPRDTSCFDTRAKVLIRDSKGQVTFRPNNKCVVAGGLWHEPYAGSTLTAAADVQIDHVVALKNAYVTGAHRWDFAHRCLYANFLGNDFHLLAVDGRENMRKGDRSPADWMPSDRRDACSHLMNWLRVKLIWGLVLAPRESTAVKALAQQAGCDPRWFKVASTLVTQQRAVIAQNLDLCSKIDSNGDDYDGWDN